MNICDTFVIGHNKFANVSKVFFAKYRTHCMYCLFFVLQKREARREGQASNPHYL